MKKRLLIVEYIPPKITEDDYEERTRLAQFVSLFAKVGFKEVCLNPETSIKLNYSK